MSRTLSRAAGWLLTGPLAFLLAALVDLAVFGLRSVRERN
jgi:hypothetical protein